VSFGGDRGEAQLARLRNRIHRRANRNHPLSQAQENANRQKSKVRARNVFGAQQTSPDGRIETTIGIARARAKIGLQNLEYNIRRLVLERMVAA
jgi:transposase, IS5 family